MWQLADAIVPLPAKKYWKLMALEPLLVLYGVVRLAGNRSRVGRDGPIPNLPIPRIGLSTGL